MRAVQLLHLHDDGGVRQAQQFGQDDAGLAVAEIVGLQAGEDQVGRFGPDGGGQQARGGQRIEGAHFFFDVDGAVGAFGQRFADGLRGARRAGAEGDHFAAVLLLELQGFFQGVGVRLVDLVGEIGFLDPLAGGGDAQLRIARGNLLDGNDNFHREYQDQNNASAVICADLCVFLLEPLEDQAPVRAAEAEAVGKRVFDLHGPRVMRHVIQIATLDRDCRD